MLSCLIGSLVSHANKKREVQFKRESLEKKKQLQGGRTVLIEFRMVPNSVILLCLLHYLIKGSCSPTSRRRLGLRARID